MRNSMLTALQGVQKPLTAQTDVTAHQGGVVATASLINLESLACSLIGLRVDTPLLATAAQPVLKRIADELTQRLNYLDEPISVIEVDVAVQARSTVPAKVAGALEYFEVLIATTGVTLARWKKPATAGSARQQVPAELTNKTLARICQDTYEVLQHELRLSAP